MGGGGERGGSGGRREGEAELSTHVGEPYWGIVWDEQIGSVQSFRGKEHCFTTAVTGDGLATAHSACGRVSVFAVSVCKAEGVASKCRHCVASLARRN